MRRFADSAVEWASARAASLSTSVDTGQILREATDLLREVVTFDACANVAVDPDSLLPRAAAHIEDFPDWSCGPYWDAEYLHGDVLSITDLHADERGVGTLHRATEGELTRSSRYEKIFSKLGLGPELRATLSVDGHTFGLIDLARGEGQGDFDDLDLDIVTAVSEEVGRRLRHALVFGDVAQMDDADASVVILDHVGDVLSMTPKAKAMLDLIPEAKPGRTAQNVYINATVHALWARARFLAAGFDAPEAASRITLLDGRMVTMRATCTRTDDDRMGHTVLVIEPTRRSQFGPLLLAAHGLTDREGQIVTHLLGGSSARQLATALKISVHTVRTHTKRIHEKLGISSRGELSRLFIDNEFLPNATFGGSSSH